MKPWICPKCGRVWSGLVMQCQPCNAEVQQARGFGFGGTTREGMHTYTVRPAYFAAPAP